MTTNERQPGARTDERGVALVMVLLLLLVMSALAAALGVSGHTETLVARNHESLAQARASAEAGLNLAVQVAVDYLRTIDPVAIPAALNALLANPAVLGIEFDSFEELEGAADPDAGYEVSLTDDAGGVGEDGDPLQDVNSTVVIRATGYARNETSVVLEALLAPVELGAIVTDGDLDISGSVTVTGGTDADVHSNGDLNITGSVTVSGDVTASGEYDGPLAGMGGQPEKPLPSIRAEDYKNRAQYILSEEGLVELPDGSVACYPGPSGKDCTSSFGWEFDGGGAWSIRDGGANQGTFYVEGPATIASNPVLTITIIAKGSINISGKPVLTAAANELLFVTDGDLDISGGTETDVTVQGQMLVHEQISLSGSVTLGGQLIVEDAPSEDPLVDSNSISGTVEIDYNGTLGTNMFFVTGWREVR